MKLIVGTTIGLFAMILFRDALAKRNHRACQRSMQQHSRERIAIVALRPNLRLDLPPLHLRLLTSGIRVPENAGFSQLLVKLTFDSLNRGREPVSGVARFASKSKHAYRTR